jgi:hypothetical protein
VKTVAVLFILAVLAVPDLLAQGTYGTIKVTVKLRSDGTRCTTKLDPDKHTAEETITDMGDKVLKKTTYLLGPDNISVGAIFYDAKGTLLYKASYQRDGAGRVIEAAFNAADDTYLGKRVFVYGGPGDVATQVTDYDASGQALAPPQPVATAKKHH